MESEINKSMVMRAVLIGTMFMFWYISWFMMIGGAVLSIIGAIIMAAINEEWGILWVFPGIFGGGVFVFLVSGGILSSLLGKDDLII